MGEIDHLLADSAVQFAVEAMRLAKRNWEANPDPDQDPDLLFAVTTIVAFCEADPNVEKILNLARAAMRLERRERGRIRIVRD